MILSERLLALSFADYQQARRRRFNRLLEILEPLIHFCIFLRLTNVANFLVAAGNPPDLITALAQCLAVSFDLPSLALSPPLNHPHPHLNAPQHLSSPHMPIP